MNFNFLYALVRRHPPLLLHGILKRLAGLEGNCLAGQYIHLRLGGGVDGGSGGAFLYLKGAKAHYLHLVALSESIAYQGYHAAYCLLGFLFGYAGLLGKSIDKIRFIN